MSKGTPPLTPEELQLAKIDSSRKEAIAKELAKIKTESPIQQNTKDLVEGSVRDKVVATEDQYQRKGAKAAGMSAGYVATEKATGETFILKQFYIQQSDCVTDQDFINREDGVRELVGSTMYQFLLYDSASKEQLVKSSEVPPKSLYVRSKFFKETEQLSVFSGGDAGGNLNDRSPKLKTIKGFEKVIAACHMLGELDYHAGNMMVGKDGTVSKIDHGKSFVTFQKDFASMIVSTNNTFGECDYTNAITNGNLIFDAEKYSASLKQMASQLSEEQIDAIVDQRIAVLKKAGFDPRGFVYEVEFGPNDQRPTHRPKTLEDLGRLFKANIKENQNNMNEIANQVEIIAKFSNVSPEFKQGGWVEAFANSAEKDPIKYAINNNIKIDDMDPIIYAIDNNINIDGMDPMRYAVDKDLNVDPPPPPLTPPTFLTKAPSIARPLPIDPPPSLQPKASSVGTQPLPPINLAKPNTARQEKTNEATNKILEVLRESGIDDARKEFYPLQFAISAMVLLAEKTEPLGNPENPANPANLMIMRYEELLDRLLRENTQLLGNPVQRLVEEFEEIAKAATPERAAFIKAATDRVIGKHGIERGTYLDEQGKKEFISMVNTLDSLATGDRGSALIGAKNSKEYQQVKAIKEELDQTPDLGKPERLKQKLSSLDKWCQEKSQEATANTSKWTSFTKAVKAAVLMVITYCKRGMVAYKQSEAEFKQITGDVKGFAHNLDRIKKVLSTNKSIGNKPVGPKKDVPQREWER